MTAPDRTHADAGTDAAILADLSTRRAYHPSELPLRTLEAMANSKMDPKHDHLNALLHEPTPGPWGICPGHGVGGCGIDGPFGQAVVWVGEFENEGIMNPADAALISAAPDLLAALEDAIHQLECSGYCHDHPGLEMGREAIAKAKGMVP